MLFFLFFFVVVVVFCMCIMWVFSSPEPKAPGELIV